MFDSSAVVRLLTQLHLHLPRCGTQMYSYLLTWVWVCLCVIQAGREFVDLTAKSSSAPAVSRLVVHCQNRTITVLHNQFRCFKMITRTLHTPGVTDALCLHVCWSLVPLYATHATVRNVTGDPKDVKQNRCYLSVGCREFVFS